MKTFLVQFRPFLLFLGKFLLVYLLLVALYHWYLNQSENANYEMDNFTQIVANQTQFFLDTLDFEVVQQKSSNEASVIILINNNPIIRIIEGCNAISLMILFVSFVISFSGKLKTTLLFVFLGIVFIHFLNIFRIGILTIGFIKLPAYKDVMHNILFPLFIYGVVFGLWIIWVNQFSYYANKNN